MKRVLPRKALAAMGLALTVGGGCASGEPDANKPRADVMDLNNAPPSPGHPEATPMAAAPAPPAEPSSSADAVAPAAGPRKHVVAAKDTLYALATKYYGDAKQWPKIVKANPGLVPEHMPVGKTIVIP